LILGGKRVSEDFEMAEKRKFDRKPMPVEFRGRDTRGYGQLVFDGTDLSAGGAFIKSDLLLEQGEALSLEFKLPGLTRPLRAHARVAWVQRFPKEGESAGMGIEFLAMTDDDRTALAQYIQGQHLPGD
jgi:uncharacterized protein (TIGR02266 family)